MLYFELSYSALLDSIQKSEASAAKSQVAQVAVISRGAGRYPSRAAAPEGIGGRPCLLRGKPQSPMSAHALTKAVHEFYQVHTKQYWYYNTYLKYTVFIPETGGCLPSKHLDFKRTGARYLMLCDIVLDDTIFR